MYHFFHWSNPFLSYIRRFSAEIFKQAKSSRIFRELCLLCVDPFYEKPLPYLREKSRDKGAAAPDIFSPPLREGAGGGLTLAVKQNRTSQKLPYLFGSFQSFSLTRGLLV